MKPKRKYRKAKDSLEPEEPSDPSSNGDVGDASASATSVSPQPSRIIDENGEERGPYHRYSAFQLRCSGGHLTRFMHPLEVTKANKEVGVMASSPL